MIDLIYIGISFVFFAVMLAYVLGCSVLGREATTDTRGKDER